MRQANSKTLFSVFFASMALLYRDTAPTSQYRDNQYHKYGVEVDQDEALKYSTTIYVGNLSFFTTEEQIYELFSKVGGIRRIIMGLDKFKKTPCGFCFVEYNTHEEAGDCTKYVNGTKLDDRLIRCDWDIGFREGRQYGRGKSGGQVRDEYRSEFDPGRGGAGKLVAESKTGSGKSSYSGSPPSSPFDQDSSKKRQREETDNDSSKKQKSDDKNPRFRESEKNDDEDML